MRNDDHNIAPIIQFDPDLYLPLLEGDDISEGEKRELLQILWNIISEFVALGFQVHPVQQAQAACGETQKIQSSAAFSRPDALYLDHQFISENFAGAADVDPSVLEEGVDA